MSKWLSLKMHLTVWSCYTIKLFYLLKSTVFFEKNGRKCGSSGISFKPKGQKRKCWWLFCFQKKIKRKTKVSVKAFGASSYAIHLFVLKNLSQNWLRSGMSRVSFEFYSVLTSLKQKQISLTFGNCYFIIFLAVILFDLYFFCVTYMKIFVFSSPTWFITVSY